MFSGAKLDLMMPRPNVDQRDQMHRSKAVQITVVVPLYQKATTIRRAIESIQAQLFRDLEVIVVDDGSTDGGAEIVRALAAVDPRIRLLSRRNGGPGAAKNTGLSQASGDLITFLDADDEWEPHFLSDAVHYLGMFSQCDVYASAFRIAPCGLNRWEQLQEHGVSEGVWRLTAGIRDNELAMCLATVHSCSSVFRTSTVKHLGGFYERDGCRFGEDVYLWLQMMLHCTFFRCAAVSATYHMEESALGLGSGRRDLPLEPVFTDPQPIRDSCPSALRGVLERWLELHALRAVHMYAELGQQENVAYLVHAFPELRRRWADLASVKLKLQMPAVHRVLRNAIRRRRPPLSRSTE
jgi:hypothetical protein